jgi:hypothetical protein
VTAAQTDAGHAVDGLDPRPDSELTHDELASRWLRYAGAARGCARDKRRFYGDPLGADLLDARAEARSRAAEMLRTMAPSEAAAAMHAEALACREHDPPPLFGLPLAAVDRSCARYTAARAWQACAWALDPDLPEVQRRWPD